MRPRLRNALSAALIGLACLLVPFSVLASWAAYWTTVELAQVRRRLTDAYVPFDLAGFWLPVSALVLAAAGIAVAACRRRAVTATSLGTALGGGLLGLAVAVGRRMTLADLPDADHRSAAGVIYDALTGTLRTVSWLLVALGLSVACATWLTARYARRRQVSAVPVADPAPRPTRAPSLTASGVRPGSTAKAGPGVTAIPCAAAAAAKVSARHGAGSSHQA